MKKSHRTAGVLLLALLVTVSLSSLLPAQTVNVTVRFNAATCSDTLRPTHVVQIRGESKHPIIPALTWDGTSGIMMTNIGGDYWTVTFQAQPGDSISYKFWTGFSLNTSTFHWTGWDGDINSGFAFAGNNRALIVGSSDTTLPLQYYSSSDTKVDQYWRPFVAKTDTVAVYFRVNMGGVTFDPATQTVQAWGSAPMGADPAWVEIFELTRELGSVNNGSYWSGAAYVAKSSLTAGLRQNFKFVINTNGSQNWESSSDRGFNFSSAVINVTGDTTLNWVYFNNQAPHGSQVTGTVNYRLKLQALEKAGLFDRGLGDKIAVTGAKGWPPGTFDFDTEPSMLKMTYTPAIQEWVLQEPFTLFPATDIVYKYYIHWDTSRVIDGNPNFITGLVLTDGWEEPGSTGGSDRHYTFIDAGSQGPAGDFGADQQYFNSLHPKGVITHPITVTFNVDMAPAASSTTNPTNRLFIPGVDSVFVQFDGSFVPITQGKTMWGTDNRVELTDLDGNGVYSGSIDLVAPTFYQLCYRIAYRSLPTNAEVMNGGGVQRGRRYYQYIQPLSVAADSAVWPNSFSLAQMTWSVGSLTVEDPPDLNQVSGVPLPTGDLPKTYALLQNYPNPFNPSTVITYDMPKASHVSIAVYDILGRKVATLFDREQTAGTHSIQWTGINEAGSHAGTGMYLLKMQAGSFSQVRKMLLIK